MKHKAKAAIKIIKDHIRGKVRFQPKSNPRPFNITRYVCIIEYPEKMLQKDRYLRDLMKDYGYAWMFVESDYIPKPWEAVFKVEVITEFRVHTHSWGEFGQPNEPRAILMIT